MARSVRRSPSDKGRGGSRNGRAVVPADTSLEARIGKHITPRADGCWQWGDGSIRYPQVNAYGRVVSVHRWLHLMVNELEPEDWADHLAHHMCENPNCVNPKHIELVTPKEHKARHRRAS